MLEVQFSQLDPSYIKESGLWAVNFWAPIPTAPEGLDLKPSGVVAVPGLGWGGNHRHRRNEFYLNLGKDHGEGLEFLWLDDKGTRHSQKMNPGDGPYTIFVPSYVPHVVINRSSEPAVFIEFADAYQTPADVEYVPVVDTNTLK